MIISSQERNILAKPLLDPSSTEIAPTVPQDTKDNSENLPALTIIVETPAPEEKKLSLQKVMESLDAEHACPLTYQTPIIPFRIPGVPDSWELGALLYWIKILDNRTNPKNRSPLSPSDFGTTVLPDRELIALINAELLKHGYTHADLLKEYGLSLKLYEYLINLNLSPQNLSRWQRAARVLHIIRFPLFGVLLVVLLVLYGKALASLLCVNASKIDEVMYQAVLNTFTTYNYTAASGDTSSISQSNICSTLSLLGGTDSPVISNAIFSKCTPLSKLDIHHIKLYSVPPGRSTYNGQYLYDPLAGYAWASIIPLTVSCALFSSIAIYQALQRSLQMNNIQKILFSTIMLGILALGIEALISSIGIFQFLFQASAFGFSCATACNKGYFERVTINKETNEITMPNGSLEGCQSAFTPKTAGALLLAAPVAFFGGRLLQTCRKKFFQNTDTVEEQYEALAEKKFDYYSQPRPS